MGILFLPEPPWPRIRGQNLCPAASLTWTQNDRPQGGRFASWQGNKLFAYIDEAKEGQAMLNSS
jgi:hypothetical protein